MSAGAYSNAEISQEITDLLNGLTAEVNEKLGTNHTEFKILKAEQQVVAGMNYRLEVEVNGGAKINVVIHKPLPHTQQPARILDASQ